MDETKRQLPYPPTDHTIFIANLPYNFNSTQLRSFVLKYCKPLFCRVPTSAKGTPKGCGFISLSSKAEEKRVMKILKGKVIGKYPVDLSHASLSKIERYFEEKEVKEAVRAAIEKAEKQKLHDSEHDNYLDDDQLDDSTNSNEKGGDDEDKGKAKRKRNPRRTSRCVQRARARARRRLLQEELSKSGHGKIYDYESDYDYYPYYDYDDYDKYRKDARRPPPPLIPPPIPPIPLSHGPYDTSSIAANSYNQMWSMIQNPALNQQMLLYNLMNAHYLQQYALADQVKIATAAQLSQLLQIQQTQQNNPQAKPLDQSISKALPNTDLQTTREHSDLIKQSQPSKHDHDIDF